MLVETELIRILFVGCYGSSDDIGVDLDEVIIAEIFD